MDAASNETINDLISYAVLLCDRNELQTAGYYAAAAFELLLQQVPKGSRENFYEKRIGAYCLANNCIPEVRTSLNQCRVIRNQVIHYNDTRRVR